MMRHDGGDPWKSQDHHAGLRALPLKAMECEFFDYTRGHLVATSVARVLIGEVRVPSGSRSVTRWRPSCGWWRAWMAVWRGPYGCRASPRYSYWCAVMLQRFGRRAAPGPDTCLLSQGHMAYTRSRVQREEPHNTCKAIGVAQECRALRQPASRPRSPRSCPQVERVASGRLLAGRPLTSGVLLWHKSLRLS
jgi:hypothetical protein